MEAFAMREPIGRLFLDHPSSVGETYFEHMRFAGAFAASLLLAGLAATVHAVLPFLFERTASEIINRLHHRIHNRFGAR
jgi:hypothetical protein